MGMLSDQDVLDRDLAVEMFKGQLPNFSSHLLSRIYSHAIFTLVDNGDAKWSMPD